MSRSNDSTPLSLGLKAGDTVVWEDPNDEFLAFTMLEDAAAGGRPRILWLLDAYVMSITADTAISVVDKFVVFRNKPR